MNQEIKEIWIDALRSGEYVQGKHSLKYKDDCTTKYCCLGVLTELYCKEKSIPFTGAEEELKHKPHGDKGYPEEYLCKDVMEWAGLETPTPRTMYGTLSGLNDNGNSFNYIADQIEEYL